jgi:hypothetical protein
VGAYCLRNLHANRTARSEIPGIPDSEAARLFVGLEMCDVRPHAIPNELVAAGATDAISRL